MSKKIDTLEFTKDLNLLIKKHKINNMVIALETRREKVDNDFENIGLFVLANAKNKKQEKNLAQSFISFMSETGFNDKAIDFATEALSVENKRIALKLKEKNLSKEDKARLRKLRKDKINCMNKLDFEGASKARHEEKTLLGIETHPVLKLDIDDVLNYQLNAGDIEQINNQIMSGLKGWQVNKNN